MAKKVKFIDEKGNEMMLDVDGNNIQVMIKSQMVEMILTYDLTKGEVHELIHELMRLKGGG